MAKSKTPRQAKSKRSEAQAKRSKQGAGDGDRGVKKCPAGGNRGAKKYPLGERKCRDRESGNERVAQHVKMACDDQQQKAGRSGGGVKKGQQTTTKTTTREQSARGRKAGKGQGDGDRRAKGKAGKPKGRNGDTVAGEAIAIRPAEYNPRRIDDVAMAGLRNSLQIFGDLSGFVVNRRTGNIVCGHQRRAALGDVDLGQAEFFPEFTAALGPPEKRFESVERMGFVQTDAGGQFRVRMVDWDQAFEKAANLAANNTAIQGEFDNDQAAKLLEEIQADDAVNGTDTFHQVCLDELLRDVTKKDAGEVDKDVPESFQVVVECTSEREQERTYNSLTEQGHNCRVLTL